MIFPGVREACPCSLTVWFWRRSPRLHEKRRWAYEPRWDPAVIVGFIAVMCMMFSCLVTRLSSRHTRKFPPNKWSKTSWFLPWQQTIYVFPAINAWNLGWSWVPSDGELRSWGLRSYLVLRATKVEAERYIHSKSACFLYILYLVFSFLFQTS